MGTDSERPAFGPARTSEISLDPLDWDAFRALAHTALDEAIDFVRTVRDRPVWQPVPDKIRAELDSAAPMDPTPLDEVYRQFQQLILPYPTGNIHPRFFGWVHGAGLAGGIVSEMMAAAMNSNCGGRDHGAIYVERTVLDWFRTLFGFPPEASGLIVSGTSMSTLIGLGVARNARDDGSIRQKGLKEYARRLVGYASAEAHDSVRKAFEVLGLGSSALRKVPARRDFTMNEDALRRAIGEDRQAGLEPFCVIGTAGTVNTGATDNLHALADLCAEQQMWFHVDGAFGALTILSDALRPRLAGIERADSLSFDFHKWLQIPYDAGCILVRRGDLQRGAYSMRPPYLYRLKRGLGGGDDWPCEFGVELSRSFRALKIWFALKEHGMRRLGAIIDQNCAQARYLGTVVEAEPELELLAPVSLNIVCFRFRAPGMDADALDKLNEAIVEDVQLSGVAAPSATRIDGKLAIRVNITNHRTRRSDMDTLVAAVLSAGRRRASA